MRFQNHTCKHFNSRPREGANAALQRLGYTVKDFKSRPREGANNFRLRALRGRFEFQFPPPRGGELFPFGMVLGFGIDFNSRPREGANILDAAEKCVCNISIPAPARGRTAKLHKIEQSILSVC